jgi:hypothetical protein
MVGIASLHPFWQDFRHATMRGSSARKRRARRPHSVRRCAHLSQRTTASRGHVPVSDTSSCQRQRLSFMDRGTVMRRTDWKTHRLPKSGRVLTVGALSVKAANPGMAQVFAIPHEVVRLKPNNPDYPHRRYKRTTPKLQENCPAEPRRDSLTRRHLGTGSG